jgi:tRNA (cmo5U34)-methyltransferase
MSGEFSFSTVENFDNHINSSIPAYKTLIAEVLSLSTYFIKDNTNVIDLGCSTGKLLQSLIDSNKTTSVNYIGYDSSKNLYKQSECKHLIKMQDITKHNFDICNSSFITSIFTAQFLNIDDRINLFNKVYNGLNSGGAFIISEKIYIENGFIQDLFNFSHYDMKRKVFSAEDILDKQISLRKIMYPLTSKENEKILKNCGFKYIHCFYQCLNFKAWIAIK